MFIKKFLHEIFDEKPLEELFKEKKKKIHTDLFIVLHLFIASVKDDGIRHTLNKNIYKNKDDFLYILNKTENDYAAFFEEFLNGEGHHQDVTFESLTFISGCLVTFCKKDYINYSVSSTLTNILKNVKPVEKYYDIIKKLLYVKKGMCFHFLKLENNIFNDITAYAFCVSKNLAVIVIIARIFKSLIAAHGSVKDDSLNVVPIVPNSLRMCFLNDNSDKYRDILRPHLLQIFNTVVNSIIYVENPSKNTIIKERIAEFSKKRSKREFETKHYSSQPYTFIDLNVEKVRAYEEGKTWYKKGHTRWQKCGPGLSQTKLVFLAPQHPQRRKKY